MYAWIALETLRGAAAGAADSTPRPPSNLVAISNHVVSAGQPSAAWLRTLKAQGFEAVIYLAPPTVEDAVRDEHAIVAGQGLAFVNIPIDFGRPSEQDYELFAAVMRGLAKRKVLVHCQINLRASSLTFLYRVIVLREDPERASESVSRVWKPDDVWRRYIESQLRRHGIVFQPY